MSHRRELKVGENGCEIEEPCSHACGVTGNALAVAVQRKPSLWIMNFFYFVIYVIEKKQIY